MIRRLPSRPRQQKGRVVREPDPGALKRLALLLVAGLALAGGFVYAGEQHFAALRFGYQNEDLRRQRDQLAEVQRRLLLEREATAAPVRLERAARQLGLQPMQAAQISALRSAADDRTEKGPSTTSGRSSNGPDHSAKARTNR